MGIGFREVIVILIMLAVMGLLMPSTSGSEQSLLPAFEEMSHK